MKHLYHFVGILLLLSTTNCGLIFEKSIEKSVLVISTPADSATITQYTQLFKWEPVLNATTYRLEVYNNNFSSGILVYDSTVSSTQITLTFQPGEYAWRLRAENSGSQTDFHSGKLYVKKGDFKTQKVSLGAPASGITLTTAAIKFSWQTLYDARYYIIEIDTITRDFSSPVIVDTVDGSLTQTTKMMSSRGEFWWRIKAISSDNEISLYTSPQNFFYSMPNINASAPVNGNVVSKPISFQWSNIPDVDYYKLYIYTSDSVTVEDIHIVDTNNFRLSNITGGKTYFWSVTAVDTKGFIGTSSLRMKFIVNP